MTLDPAAVSKALADEGLEAISDDDGLWTMSFEINARNQPVLLSAPRDDVAGELACYVLAVSFIDAPSLQGPIADLPAATLAKLLRAQREVLLAKVDTWTHDGATHYVAVSPCDAAFIDGPALRRRLEACADLAARIRAALLDS